MGQGVWTLGTRGPGKMWCQAGHQGRVPGAVIRSSTALYKHKRLSPDDSQWGESRSDLCCFLFSFLKNQGITEIQRVCWCTRLGNILMNFPTGTPVLHPCQNRGPFCNPRCLRFCKIPPGYSVGSAVQGGGHPSRGRRYQPGLDQPRCGANRNGRSGMLFWWKSQ